MSKSNKFGTFGGVFTPSILTILGVIMYLRLPMIVGEVGLLTTLGIILVAHIISVTTGLSVSSIATDKKVEAGGTYYMISRSLGLPIGGTLGLALFVGLSFSVSLYLIGFSESFLSYWGYENTINNIRITGSVVLVAVTTLTLISTSMAIKTQYLIMAAIVLSLASIFLGTHDLGPSDVSQGISSSTVSVMVLFGIFFPAVTGFEAGVSMSGDLKDPKKSIPTGSILAIVVGFIVYVGFACYLYFTVDAGVLATDSNVLLNISWIPELVIAGIWGATLSSALGSILGAPRILQATSTDKITPRFFGKGYGKANEPRNALLLTFLIAEAGILIGELDVIARVVSIFFITTYGFLNVSAAFESWTSSDFRPEFKVSGWISLLGALACVLVMIQLDFVAMVAAVLILGLLFLFLKRRQLTLNSGDAWNGVWASLVKTGLTRLKKEKIHTRNWRPNIIMFSGSPDKRQYIAEMGKAIAGNLGILSAFELYETDEKSLSKAESMLATTNSKGEYFSYKFGCTDIYSGMEEISRVYGFSGVEPNTILMGWSRAPKNKEQFAKALRGFRRGEYNNIFIDYDEDRKFGQLSTIDIWWGGKGPNLSFSLTLIRNLVASSLWKLASVRLMIIDESGVNHEAIYKEAKAILANARLDVTVRVIKGEGDNKQIIVRESAETDLVMLGLDGTTLDQLDRYYDGVNEILDKLGTTMIVSSSSYFESFEIAEKVKDVPSTDASGLLKAIPTLQPSRFPEVTVNIYKIDQNGRKLQQLLFAKGFRKSFENNRLILGELLSLLKTIEKELESIRKLKEAYKKAKALDKLRNEASYRLGQLFKEKVFQDLVPEQVSRLREATTEYMERLAEDYKLYPKNLPVSYSKEAFAEAIASTPGASFYKGFRRAIHFVVGYPLIHKVVFRALAGYFQWGGRLSFLSGYLAKHTDSVFSFYAHCRNVINTATTIFDEEERNWSATIGAEIEQLTRLLEQQKEEEALFEARLLLEHAQNMQLMSRSLEQLFPMKESWKRSSSPEYVKAKREGIEALLESFDSDLKTMLNKVIMEQEINRVKNRIGIMHRSLNDGFAHMIESRVIKKIDKYLKMPVTSSREVVFELETDWELELQETLDYTTERFLETASEMPETLEVLKVRTSAARLESESVEIPVSKMAEYFLKTKLITTLEEEHERAIDGVKRCIYAIKEAGNLLRFKLDNAETSNSELSLEEILKEFSQKADREKKEINNIVNQFVSASEKCFIDAFEPLKSYKIEEAASAFGYGFKSMKGRKVARFISKSWQRVAQLASKSVSQLLYSRSEGLLFARKLSNKQQVQSLPGRILDIKEIVSPQEKILKELPGYYVSLFNGRSSIGKDFWVPRSKEEEIFKKAVSRYKNGYLGGILIVGERNEGKTAFTKHAVSRFGNEKNFYSVFPPLQGTLDVAEFERSLQKATLMHGNAREILTQLPPGSIVSVNDLELFWERHADGMRVVQALGDLIDEFSSRCLFVVNVNPHTFKLIDQLTGFSQKFIEIISMEGFDAEMIKEVIMKRHKSSGLTLSFGKNENNLSEIELARLFNKYFDYSGGNAGTALNGWLANIASVSHNQIEIIVPPKLSLTFLRNLDEEWVMILTQFVLHKRLDLEKIRRITGWKSIYVSKLLLALTRSGVIVEKASGVHMIDPYLLPFIVRHFKERDLL
jgi:amino acid transporter